MKRKFFSHPKREESMQPALDEDSIVEALKKEGQRVEPPDSIMPEQLRRKLRKQKTQKAARYRIRRAAAAICACVVVVCGTAAVWQEKAGSRVVKEQRLGEDRRKQYEEQKAGETENVTDKEEVQALEPDSRPLSYPEITYEEIYASLSEIWEKETNRGNQYKQDELMVSGAVMESAVADTGTAYGATNIQTQGVEEGDIVKNDGRYLYQRIQEQSQEQWKWTIQITDTQEGLKVLSRIEDLENVVEFYVWENTLVVLEAKYKGKDETALKRGDLVELGYTDVLCYQNPYHEISIYDISDRKNPEKQRTFVVDGSYHSSRLTDGYLYSFATFYAEQGEGKDDYAAYIPNADGMLLAEEEIFLTEEHTGTSYLVMVSIDLQNPLELLQKTAVLAGGNNYYVSGSNIYVTESRQQRISGDDSRTGEETKILRFAYAAGKFDLQAEGSIQGTLEDSFSLDEYNGYLRAVTTVREYGIRVNQGYKEEIVSATFEEQQSNALYVLDESLQVVGQIEGLAEEEQIYAARFLGDIGYFVTFRQTDPLFAVDLSDPCNPQILSELKVSGFSEYLHFYGADRLLGLGEEVEEATGLTQGMKLSMFDISKPQGVQEITRLQLPDYYYSEALYNHRAIMIDTVQNLFGFEAEGHNSTGNLKKYFVYSYEDDAFVLKLCIDTQLENQNNYSTRGTFIGDKFYLLYQNGSIRSYNWKTGEALEAIYPDRERP